MVSLGSEIDDLSSDSDIPNTAEAHPGVDDAFFGSPPAAEGEGVGEDAGKAGGEWEGGDTEDEDKKEGDEDGNYNNPSILFTSLQDCHMFYVF